jgi:predicted nucleic acid-binding protein
VKGISQAFFCIDRQSRALVTGDKDLLDVAGQVRELTITNPRGFWSLARKSSEK